MELQLADLAQLQKQKEKVYKLFIFYYSYNRKVKVV